MLLSCGNERRRLEREAASPDPMDRRVAVVEPCHPILILPADVAVTTRAGSTGSAAMALSMVRPVVMTSSTRTAPAVSPRRARKATGPRPVLPAPAWRDHHSGAVRARETGSPTIPLRAVAKRKAGSTPLIHFLAPARGTGTSMLPPATSGAIDAASSPSLPAIGRYFRLCTSCFAAPE